MFKPLNDRILVKPLEKVNETPSGLYLAEKVSEKPVTGIVIVGNELVEEGNKILFSKFGYDEVTLDDELHYVVSKSNILGIF